MTEGIIEFGDFQKLDLRVAEIKKVEAIEGADKLWKMKVDVGELGERTICAGIKKHYSDKELVGKKIVIVANLEPRKLRGVESKGMLLAAVSAPLGVPQKSELGGKDKLVLVTVDRDVQNGIRIS